MAIPDFQTLMLPFIKVVSDGKEYEISEVRNMLAQKLEITPQERRELLPSGTQPVFDNSVAWTKTHLEKAFKGELVEQLPTDGSAEEFSKKYKKPRKRLQRNPKPEKLKY